MEEKWKSISVSKIVLAMKIEKGMGKSRHENRPSHGFAFLQNKKIYKFDNSKAIETSENSIIYLPKGSNYSVYDIDECEACYAINFDTADIFFSAPFLIKPKNYAKILEDFKKADIEFKNQKDAYELRVKSLLYDIIYRLYLSDKEIYLPSETTNILLPAIDEIHEKYTSEEIKIPKLAELCGISEVYFRKLFRSVMGASPKEYVITLKIERAKELISSRLVSSLTEVARLSGYEDYYYFSREFKSCTGVSPTEFKKGML